nr:DHHW family protein [Sedimentibacter sp.]
MNTNKQYVFYINIGIFMILIFTISIFNMLSPKDKTISEVENRTLAKKPVLTIESILSGKYSRDFENYFADNFAVRDNLVVLSKDIASLKGIKRAEEVALVDFDGQNVGGDSGEDKDGNVEASTKGNLLILNDKVMELYKFNEAKSKSYANMINTVQSKLSDDVKVYSLLAPVQVEFLTNKKYKDLSDSQYDGIHFVNSNLSEKIIPVDAYTPIKEHINEYVYYRTDHHWTALGAYYAYTGFAEAAGIDPLPLDKFTKGEAPGFLGHLSTVNPSETVNNNPDNVIFYNSPAKSDMDVYYYDKETGEKKSYKGSVISKSYIDGDQKYGVFLGGDFALGVIKTNSNTNKKIMVIKDSYANAFIPFLLTDYSEIYVVDPRHYKENIIDLVNENSIDEVMFLNYILTTNFDSYVNSVLNLIK